MDRPKKRKVTPDEINRITNAQQEKEKASQEPQATSDAEETYLLQQYYNRFSHEIREWVQTYYTAGFVPLICFPTKNPAYEKWEEFKKTRPTLLEIFQKVDYSKLDVRTACLGVIQLSNDVRFFVIDIDKPWELANVELGIDFTHKTLIARTKKGIHILLRAKNYFPELGARKEFKAGDLLFVHNIIVPPSRLDGIRRNWYYVSIEEALYCMQTENWPAPVSPSDFLAYIDELPEIDLQEFELTKIYSKQGAIRYETREPLNPSPTPIESLDSLKQQIISIVKPYWTEHNRHDLAKALASYCKYRLASLGISHSEAINFTLDVVKELVGQTADNELLDRVRAVNDTFKRERTEHRRTLANKLGDDFKKLKATFRQFSLKKQEADNNTELQNVILSIARDLRAVTYSDNTYTLWFANGDAVEFSERTLYTYAVQTYKFFPEIKKRDEEIKIRWSLYKAVEKLAAEKRVKKLKKFRQGIYQTGDTFLMVFDDDLVFIYDIPFDDYYQVSKVHNDAIIEVSSPLTDFDIPLLRQLLEIPKDELLKRARSIHNEICLYLQSWNFEVPEAIPFLASLLIALPTHTSWKWRPIIHVYGVAGSGKTTLFENTFKAVYPTLCLQLSDTSKAGILQTVSDTSYVVLLDNLETSQAKKQDFFTLLEGASTGFEENKGTKDGKGITYTYRQLTIINSVKDFIVKEALDTRVIQIILHRPKGTRPESPSEGTAKRWATTSLAFTIRFWDEISSIYGELAKFGRTLQNIAYPYAIDSLLNGRSLQKYEALFSQKRTQPEEIQFFKDILYSRVYFEKEQHVILDSLIEYLRAKKGKGDELAKYSALRRHIGYSGVKLIDSPSDVPRIVFHYLRLVKAKILDKNEVVEGTFQTMISRVAAVVPNKECSVYFGKSQDDDKQHEWSVAFDFFELLKFLGINEVTEEI